MSENGYIGRRFPKIESSKMTDSGNRVVVRLHHAYLSPAIAEAVSRSLECTTKDFFLGGPFGLRSKSKRHAFYVRDADGYIRFHAGLVPRVIDELSSVGIDAQIDDRSRWPVLEQLVAQLPDIVNDKNRCLLNAVAASPRGQIVAHVRDHLKLVILLCRAFASVRVLIVIANRKQRDKLCCQLSAKLKRPVSTHDGIRWGAPNRVTLVTADFFTGISVSNVDFDVVIFTHPSCVTIDQAYETASQLNSEVLYCFRPTKFQSDELTQLRLEAICGAVIHDDVASDTAVQVVMLDTPSIRVPTKMSPLERKRTTIWHNEQRNDVVAMLPLAIAEQDARTFSPRSEFLPEHIDLLTAFSDLGIAILVESIEHGRELHQRLPEWTLHTAIPDQDGSFDGGTCHRSIVTEAFASMGIQADIVIRAAGTDAPLMVKGFPAIGHRRASLLFDLADDFDEQARRDTGQRIDDYRSRGWTVETGNKWATTRDASEMKTRKSHTGATA